MRSMDETRKVYTVGANVYDTYRFESKAGKYRFKVERLKLLNHLKGPKILELGAGTARYGIFFAKLGFDYTGIDITPKMLEVAKEKAKKEKLHLNLLEMDAHELGFKDNTFDSVFCDRTVKFFHKPIKVFKEAHRVLKPTGKMIVDAETPKMALKYWAKKLPITNIVGKMSRCAETGYFMSSKSFSPPDQGVKFYYKEEISDMFKAARFRVIDVEQLFHVPTFILPLIPSRLLGQLLKLELKSKRGILGSKILVVGEK